MQKLQILGGLTSPISIATTCFRFVSQKAKTRDMNILETKRWGDLYQSGGELFAAYVSHKRRLQVYIRLVNSSGNLSSQVKLLTSRFRVNWVFLKESSNNLFCNGTARTVVTQNEATMISLVRFSSIQQHSKNQGENSLYSIKNTVVSLQIKST